MFILKTNDVDTVMFAKGQKVESDINLWHKQFDNVNFPLWKEDIQEPIKGTRDIIVKDPSLYKGEALPNSN